MTDDARLTPFTVAVYTATYASADLAIVVASMLATRWGTAIAVVAYPDCSGYAVYDLAEDPTGNIERLAVHIAVPETVDVADVTDTGGRL